MAETTKQPEADYVELTVHQPIDSTSQKFKIKKKATFAKLMAVYSQKVVSFILFRIFSPFNISSIINFSVHWKLLNSMIREYHKMNYDSGSMANDCLETIQSQSLTSTTKISSKCTEYSIAAPNEPEKKDEQ